MALAARFITVAALARRESRGGHYRADYPTSDAAQAHRSHLTLEQVERVSRAHRLPRWRVRLASALSRTAP